MESLWWHNSNHEPIAFVSSQAIGVDDATCHCSGQIEGKYHPHAVSETRILFPAFAYTYINSHEYLINYNIFINNKYNKNHL